MTSSPQNIKLTQIWLNRPSVIRNTLMVVIIRFLAGVLSLAFLVVGLVLIINYKFISPLLHEYIPASFASHAEEKQTAIVIGVALILLSLLMSFLVWLCKMLLRRNFFINELELYMHEENEDMEKFAREMEKIKSRD